MRISDWSSDVCSSDLGAPPSTILNHHAPDLTDVAGIAPAAAVQSGVFLHVIPIYRGNRRGAARGPRIRSGAGAEYRSEEHTSELQSLMRIPYAVFCLKKKKKHKRNPNTRHNS